MDFKDTRSEFGFTLIEILVSIFVFVLVLLALFLIVDWQYKTYNYETTVARLGTENQQVIDELQRYIMQGGVVDSDQIIGGFNYVTDNDTLILKVPGIDSNGDVLFSWDYIVFHAEGNKLYLRSEASGVSVRPTLDKLLTESLSALTFTYNDIDFNNVNQITANIVLQKPVRNLTVTNSLEQNIYLRNY